jgi:hypothetical protein
MVRSFWPNLMIICNAYIYSLNNISVTFSMETNTGKETKIMAYRGIESIRSKICISMMQEIFECKNIFC